MPMNDDNYTCLACEKGKTTVTTDKVTIRDLYLCDPQAVLKTMGLKFDKVPSFTDMGRLFQMKDRLQSQPVQLTKSITWNKKPVLNVQSVLEFARSWVSTGTIQHGECQICFDEFKRSLLIPLCGSGKCRAHACIECAKSWYTQPKPGHNVKLTNLLCPYCKQVPKGTILKRCGGRQLLYIRGATMDPKFHHAWCVKCYKIKKHVEKICAQEPPKVDNFVCEDCDDSVIATMSTPCPSCNAPTIKSSGCNHIECVCGAHWCYECGDEFDEDEIYDHMDEEHGGIY
jgi:hypothetical protein